MPHTNTTCDLRAPLQQQWHTKQLLFNQKRKRVHWFRCDCKRMFKHNCQLRCALLHTVNWYLPVRKMNTHHACQFVCVVTFTVLPAHILSFTRRFWCNRLPTQYNLCISTKHCLSRQIFAFQYDIGFKFIVFSVHSTSSSSVCLLEQCFFFFSFSFLTQLLCTILMVSFDTNLLIFKLLNG